MALTLEQLEQKVLGLETENAALKKQVTGAETLLQQHKTEIGDARKEFKTAIEAASSDELRKQLKEQLDKLTVLSENLNRQPPGNQDKGGERPKSAAEAKAKLSDQQKKVADAVWQKLPEPQKRELLADETKMVEFLGIAAQEVESPVPDSLFAEGARTPAPGSLEGLREMFKAAATQCMRMPARGHGSAPAFAGSSQDEGEEQQTRRLPGGVIPRGRAQAQT